MSLLPVPTLPDEISLRDYFAGQVLGTIYADYIAAYNDKPALDGWSYKDVLKATASDVWALADAMLAARNKAKPHD